MICYQQLKGVRSWIKLWLYASDAGRHKQAGQVKQRRYSQNWTTKEPYRNQTQTAARGNDTKVRKRRGNHRYLLGVPACRSAERVSSSIYKQIR